MELIRIFFQGKYIYQEFLPKTIFFTNQVSIYYLDSRNSFLEKLSITIQIFVVCAFLLSFLLFRLIFIDFKLEPRSHEGDLVEPWSPAILPRGARSPLKYGLETRSPKPLRGPQMTPADNEKNKEFLILELILYLIKYG